MDWTSIGGWLVGGGLVGAGAILRHIGGLYREFKRQQRADDSFERELRVELRSEIDRLRKLMYEERADCARELGVLRARVSELEREVLNGAGKGNQGVCRVCGDALQASDAG